MPLLTLTFNISPSVRCAGVLKFGFFDEILKKKECYYRMNCRYSWVGTITGVHPPFCMVNFWEELMVFFGLVEYIFEGIWLNGLV